MADIEIEKKHNLEFDKAREQAKKWLQNAREEYGLDTDYIEGENEDTATINRKGMKGKAVLDIDKIRFEGDLAFIAKPLKGKIQGILREGINEYFG